MENLELKRLQDTFLNLHNKLDDNLLKIDSSELLRNYCMGGYIKGFIGVKKSELKELIYKKTGIEFSSIKKLGLIVDEEILSYLLLIEERLLQIFDPSNVRGDLTNNHYSQYFQTVVDLGKDFRDAFKNKQKEKTGKVVTPETYLINYLKTSTVVPKKEEVKEIPIPVYDPNSSIREQLKEANKMLADLLFNRGYPKEAVINILHQRYMFYGVGIDQKKMFEERIKGKDKNPKHLYDFMTDEELLNHFTISSKMIDFLNKHKFASYKELESAMRAIAVDEQVFVYNMKKGFHPLEYQNKPVEDKKEVSSSQVKKVMVQQTSLFDKMS